MRGFMRMQDVNIPQSLMDIVHACWQKRVSAAFLAQAVPWKTRLGSFSEPASAKPSYSLGKDSTLSFETRTEVPSQQAMSERAPCLQSR